jgi:hypothetical protein
LFLLKPIRLNAKNANNVEQQKKMLFYKKENFESEKNP